MGSINAYDAALLDKDVMQRNIAFLCYSMQWLVRLVDPRHAHPNQMIRYVLLLVTGSTCVTEPSPP